MKTVDIKKSFLNNSYFTEIQDTLTSSDFPWYYNFSDTDNNEKNPKYMFTHSVVNSSTINSNYFQLLKPICHQIYDIQPWSEITRMKINCYPNQKEKIIFNKHKDDETGRDIFGAILHINTNNGETVMCEGGAQIKIKSKENTLIIFDNSVEHYGTTQTDTDLRILINFNFIKK